MKLISIADLTTHNFTPPFDLVAQYHAYLSQPESEDDGRAPGIHASEIATCVRQSYYSLIATKKVKLIDPEMKKRFEVGKALHTMLQTQFHEMTEKDPTLSYASEVTMEGTTLAKDYEIQSSCDGVFTYDDGKVSMRMGLEIKTEAPDSYAKLNSPRPKHIIQAHLYMACLDLPQMWFAYWNKGNQNITPMKPPWLINFDRNVWMSLEHRIHQVLEARDKQELPDREEGYHCSWCPYSHTCHPKSLNRQPTKHKAVRL